MYNGIGLPSAAAAGAGGVGISTLPYTGLNLTFLFLAGFALIAAGLALWRAIPKREE